MKSDRATPALLPHPVSSLVARPLSFSPQAAGRKVVPAAELMTDVEKLSDYIKKPAFMPRCDRLALSTHCGAPVLLHC